MSSKFKTSFLCLGYIFNFFPWHLHMFEEGTANWSQGDAITIRFIWSIESISTSNSKSEISRQTIVSLSCVVIKCKFNFRKVNILNPFCHYILGLSINFQWGQTQSSKDLSVFPWKITQRKNLYFWYTFQHWIV